MEKNEAIQAMKDGKKVTHRYFSEGEWCKSSSDGKEIYTEDGYTHSASEFWSYRETEGFDNGWSIVEDAIVTPQAEDGEVKLNSLQWNAENYASGYAKRAVDYADALLTQLNPQQ